MTTDDEQTDDVAHVTRVPATERPGAVPFDRRDYGDAEQLAELTEVDEPDVAEPVPVVDEPVPVPPPYGRAEKRRNQRRIPR
ncbi:hypothetical protein ACFY3U_15025 [Micromonospora sp. NPDC000089]|uniref:hypothetical protein n=1 Tax=unclassified Micromonospora TaxID=2617518 RepID=UPI0036C033E5